jgi:hypothetical protein
MTTQNKSPNTERPDRPLKDIDKDKRGPFGDTRPELDQPQDMEPSLPPEPIEDRETEDIVTPEDYPLSVRQGSAVDLKEHNERRRKDQYQGK